MNWGSGTRKRATKDEVYRPVIGRCAAAGRRGSRLAPIEQGEYSTSWIRFANGS